MSAQSGVSSLGTLPYQPQGRGGLVQAASVEQQASGTVAGLLGAPETSRRLLAGRVRAPPVLRLRSVGLREFSLQLCATPGMMQGLPVIIWQSFRHRSRPVRSARQPGRWLSGRRACWDLSAFL